MTKLELAAPTSRLIWLRRNAVVHGKAFTNPNFLVQKVTEEHKVFKYNQETLLTSHVAPQHCSTKWKAPLKGVYKVDWDAIVDNLQ